MDVMFKWKERKRMFTNSFTFILVQPRTTRFAPSCNIFVLKLQCRSAAALRRVRCAALQSSILGIPSVVIHVAKQAQRTQCDTPGRLSLGVGAATASLCIRPGTVRHNRSMHALAPA